MKSRRFAVVLVGSCLLSLLLMASPASAALGDRPLKRGSSGADVARLQSLLTKLGFQTTRDSSYGPGTARSVRRFEQSRKARVNGRVSRAEARLIERLARAPKPRSEKTTPEPEGGSFKLGDRDLREGMRGDDVKAMQSLLAKLGFDTTADGVFGSGTGRRLREYEDKFAAPSDGVLTRAEAPELERHASEVRRGEEAPPPAEAPAGNYVFPVRGAHRYGDGFGAPRGSRSHQGVDIMAASGTPLVSVSAGKVAFRQYQGGGAGHYLVVHGDDGTDYVYMHMLSAATVGPGQRVTAGQQIGRVGSTGSSTAPHLHFETWSKHWYDGGKPSDPLARLKEWDRSS